tara:strand:+ start:17557 stop:17838 length:282 start_codon:yes stop_codon:yes gene_type:complete
MWIKLPESIRAKAVHPLLADKNNWHATGPETGIVLPPAFRLLNVIFPKRDVLGLEILPGFLAYAAPYGTVHNDRLFFIISCVFLSLPYGLQKV